MCKQYRIQKKGKEIVFLVKCFAINVWLKMIDSRLTQITNIKKEENMKRGLMNENH